MPGPENGTAAPVLQVGTRADAPDRCGGGAHSLPSGETRTRSSATPEELERIRACADALVAAANEAVVHS